MPTLKKTPPLLDLQMKLHGLLKRPDAADFLPQITQMEEHLLEHFGCLMAGIRATPS